MTYLNKRILENLDRYQHFSGLTGLRISAMWKKTDNGLELLPHEGQVKDYINPGDNIYFDIDMTEIWLDIDMEFKSENINWIINFEIKVETYHTLADLKNHLMSLGIKLLNGYLINEQSYDELAYYYLLVNFCYEIYKNPSIDIDKLNSKGIIYNNI